ncbi:DinB family protein [Pseudoduganella sp. UC29_106]|uniref:DinB family protein n=1 Tax=Pseudoduganella sp. UC29_106 TaxID=3374553 RepID=UPI003756E430
MTANRLSRHLRAAAYNNAWANHRLLRACAQLSQENFEAGRTGFFPSLKATLNHILTVDWFYIDALERNLRGEPPHPDYQSFFRPEQPFASAAELRAAQRASDQRLIDYASNLTDDMLDEIVVIQRIGHEQRDTRERLLAHVYQHQIHHRGQVHNMLSATPVAPPQLDEFYAAGEAPLRTQDFIELGWTEEQIWGIDNGR